MRSFVSCRNIVTVQNEGYALDVSVESPPKIRLFQW